MMRTVLRNVMSFSAAIAMIVALAVPALADDVSGTYRIVTATGKHMIVTLIENGDSVTGMYVGNNGVAGRLTGQFKPDGSVAYTWVQRQGDSGNEKTYSGWGNMTFNTAGTILKTAWGYDGQTRAVGFWNATLITP